MNRTFSFTSAIPDTRAPGRAARWLLTMVAAAAALGGCALPPHAAGPAPTPVPPAWQNTLPAASPATDLSRWWQQFDDPLLSQLIDSAQTVSPTVAAAAARIAQARLVSVQAGALGSPLLEAEGGVSRGRPDLLSPVARTASVSLSASWELDVFGAQRAAQQAAQARWQGAQAGWHDARVVVAAEVAQAYLALRACEAQLGPIEADARSRQDTARVTEHSAQAGFQAPAVAALARASAAQGQQQLIQQRAQCQLYRQALGALTGRTPQQLAAELPARTARLPQPAGLAVTAVPAQVLAQRPDVFDAEREVLAAQAAVNEQQALRYPRVALLGSVGRARVDAVGVSQSGTVWSVGPVSVSFPVWDAGLRRANVVAAQAQVDEARARYSATLRRAIQEVEEALIRLQSASDRQVHAQAAVAGYAQSFRATQALFRTGGTSLLALEDTRRSQVQAQSALISLQQDHVAAWVALYRALGGGWTPSSDAQAPVAALYSPAMQGVVDDAGASAPKAGTP